MRKFVIKLSTLFFMMAVVLTASPAHANLAALIAPPLDFALQGRTDIGGFEGLRPLDAPAPEFIEEEITEDEVSSKLSQIRAMQHMMRSA